MSSEDCTNSLEKLVQIQDHQLHDANKKEYISCAITCATIGLIIAVIIAGIIMLFSGGMMGSIILSFIVLVIGGANYLCAPGMAEMEFDAEVVNLTARLKKQGITSSQDSGYLRARNNSSDSKPPDIAKVVDKEQMDRLAAISPAKTGDFIASRRRGGNDDTESLGGESIGSEELFGNAGEGRMSDFNPANETNQDNVVVGAANIYGF